MRTRDILRFPFEVAGVCLARVLIPFLPRSWVVGLARFCGSAGFRFSRRDRKIAMANLDAAFGSDISGDTKKAIAIESFQTFTLVLLDYFWFSAFTLSRVNRYVKLDPSFDHAINTTPLIFLTAHFGNWEVMGLAFTLRCGRLLSVAARMENPVVDYVLRHARSGTGQVTVNKEGALKSLVKELKQKGRVALVMDQNVLPEDGGEFVDLFGLPVPMSKAAERLQSHSRADVVFTYCLPDGKGHYTAYAMPPCLFAEEDAASASNTTKVFAGMLETVVRNHPGKWLWAYKRWKFVPEGTDVGKFPYYAKSVGQGLVDSGVAKKSQ